MKYDEICKVEETTNQLSVFPLHLEFWGIRPISTNIRRFQGPSLPAAGTPQHASPTSCRPLNVHDLLKMNICRRQECNASVIKRRIKTHYLRGLVSPRTVLGFTPWNKIKVLKHLEIVIRLQRLRGYDPTLGLDFLWLPVAGCLVPWGDMLSSSPRFISCS